VVVAPNRMNDMNLSRSPVKIAEYMAIGAPIVANAVGLAKDMLSGGAGELVLTESPEEMADKIIRVLTDKKESSRISANAAQKAKKYYTWERLAGMLNRFIDKNFDKI
jgi:glycosyltransferase involved in cell wall biosynthesis